MVRDLWNTIDLPLLRAFCDIADEVPLNPLLSPEEAQVRADLSELSFEQLVASVVRLRDAGLLKAELYRAGGGVWQIGSVSGLAERGLRAVGAWPSDDPLGTLLSILEERESAEADPAIKSRLRRFRDALKELGPQIASGLLVTLATRAAGGW